VRILLRVCLAASVAVLALPLGAQMAKSDTAATRFEIAAGIMASTPKDVNQRPKCDELGLPCESARTFPDFGFVVQAAVTTVPHVALVGEASVYYDRWDTVAANIVDRARDNYARALLVGPRVMSGFFHTTSLSQRTSPSRAKELGTIGYRVFAQVLAGPEMSKVTPTRLAIQPGAGIDFKLSYPDTWLRVAGDYRSTSGGPRNLSTGRATVGLVVAQ
jgi:hypothetical protein